MLLHRGCIRVMYKHIYRKGGLVKIRKSSPIYRYAIKMLTIKNVMCSTFFFDGLSTR